MASTTHIIENIIDFLLLVLCLPIIFVFMLVLKVSQYVQKFSSKMPSPEEARNLNTTIVDLEQKNAELLGKCLAAQETVTSFNKIFETIHQDVEMSRRDFMLVVETNRRDMMLLNNKFANIAQDLTVANKNNHKGMTVNQQSGNRCSVTVCIH